MKESENDFFTEIVGLERTDGWNHLTLIEGVKKNHLLRGELNLLKKKIF